MELADYEQGTRNLGVKSDLANSRKSREEEVGPSIPQMAPFNMWWQHPVKLLLAAALANPLPPPSTEVNPIRLALQFLFTAQ